MNCLQNSILKTNVPAMFDNTLVAAILVAPLLGINSHFEALLCNTEPLLFLSALSSVGLRLQSFHCGGCVGRASEFLGLVHLHGTG